MTEHNNNNGTQNETRSKRNRLIVIILITLGFAIYSYGWRVTEIDLEKPQEEKRQENVQNSLRELLSPRIFDQDVDIVQLETPYRVVCSDDDVIEEALAEPPYIRVSPTCGEIGDEVTIEVVGFEPGAEARIRWIPPDGESRPRDILETESEEFFLDANGQFDGTIEVPRIRGSEDQTHQVAVRAAIPAGPPRLSDTTEVVIRRMIETIFMALVATSIAIPIAALISFLAARNLMRPIKLTLGTLFLMFNSFVIGGILGGIVLTGLGRWVVGLGKGDVGGIIVGIAALVAVVAGIIFYLRTITSDKSKGEAPGLVQDIATKAISGLAIFAVVGLVAGILIWVGGQLITFGDSLRPQFIQDLLAQADVVPPLEPSDWIQNSIGDAVSSFGNVLNIIGSLVELMIGVVAALVGGYLLMTIASSLFSAPLRLVTGQTARLLGLALGILAGIFLFGFLGLIGTWAALLGLLAPIVAATIGAPIAVMLYTQFIDREQLNRREFELTNRDRTLRRIVFIIGAVVGFILAFEYLGVGRALVNGTLPNTDTINILGFELNGYILSNMIVGAVLGGVGGFLAGTRSAFPLGNTLYTVSRAILNTIRSIEPLIMGLVFVIWVGIGPFAGVLALTLHSIAALGKLYSEQIENIDEGPIEAVQSTGASWLQTVVYAVVPQIIPPYIAFTMYRWDINVRMSTIIGFVGGGGIGLLLQQQINLLQYREAGVAVLAIAIVVSALDYASASIRDRTA